MDTITTQFHGADSPLQTVWLHLEYDPRLGAPALIAFCGPEAGPTTNYTILKTPRLGCVVVHASGGATSPYTDPPLAPTTCSAEGSIRAINLASFPSRTSSPRLADAAPVYPHTPADACRRYVKGHWPQMVRMQTLGQVDRRRLRPDDGGPSKRVPAVEA
jgi:hypothetical protein